LTTGILKDPENDMIPKVPKDIPPPPIAPEPTITDSIYNAEIDAASMVKYPPLIPLPSKKLKGLIKRAN